jgi:hypothetical protein
MAYLCLPHRCLCGAPRRVARHRAAPDAAAAPCAVKDCPHPAVGYSIARGWERLCRAHVAVRWRHLSKGRQRFYLRRYKKRLREASAAERASRRAMMRKLDGTDGRRHRREISAAKAGRLTRAAEDARKRAICAESENQRKPWERLGISRASYYRRKLGATCAADVLHAPADRVRQGKRRQKLPYTDKQAPTEPAATGESRRDRGAVRGVVDMPNPSIRAVARQSVPASFLVPNADLSARFGFGASPHRFAGGLMQIGQLA